MSNTVAKIKSVGKRLPYVGAQQCFRFTKSIEFNLQRDNLKRIGASEVANIFTGERDLAQVMTTRLYKAFGKKQQEREETLGMKKGKLLENLGFEEFIRLHGDEIQALYKNKYSNGIDKYNYFKKIDGADNLVGATIDGWFINNCGEAELLEIKCSDKTYLSDAIRTYNKNGNFLVSRYFFKYYIQVQMQLACTGLNKANLFFLVGDTPINCLVNRNNALVAKILEYVLLLENEIISLRQFMEHDREVNVYGLDEDELACYIEKLVTGSNFYSKLADFDYVSEFVEFAECVKLELEESSAICLEENIEKIRELKACLKEYEREHIRVTKPIKDDIKRLLEVVNTQNPLIESESIAYRFGDKIFSLNMSKRAIADKLTLYSKPKILDTTTPTEDVSGISRWLNLDYSPIITDVSNLAFAN